MRILLASCLVLVGYLIGSIERPTAQSQGYLYGSDEYGSIHTPQPGGPSYYYGMDGSVGTIMPSTPPPTMDFSMPRHNPC